MTSTAFTWNENPRSNLIQLRSAPRVWHTVSESSVHRSMISSEVSTSMTSVSESDWVVDATPVSAESKPPEKKMRFGRIEMTVSGDTEAEKGGAGLGGGLGGLSTSIASKKVVGYRLQTAP